MIYILAYEDFDKVLPMVKRIFETDSDVCIPDDLSHTLSQLTNNPSVSNVRVFRGVEQNITRSFSFSDKD